MTLTFLMSICDVAGRLLLLWSSGVRAHHALAGRLAPGLCSGPGHRPDGKGHPQIPCSHDGTSDAGTERSGFTSADDSGRPLGPYKADDSGRLAGYTPVAAASRIGEVEMVRFNRGRVATSLTTAGELASKHPLNNEALDVCGRS